MTAPGGEAEAATPGRECAPCVQGQGTGRAGAEDLHARTRGATQGRRPETAGDLVRTPGLGSRAVACRAPGRLGSLWGSEWDTSIRSRGGATAESARDGVRERQPGLRGWGRGRAAAKAVGLREGPARLAQGDSATGCPSAKCKTETRGIQAAPQLVGTR